MPSQYLLLALLALFLPLMVVVAAEDLKSWEPITNTSDLDVIKIAEFAISENNKKTKKNLVFQNVVKGRLLDMFYSGKYYDIVIRAKEDESTSTNPIANYKAVVLDDPWARFIKLYEFVKVPN